MNLRELEPSVEVVHLRRLLDTQPSCLLRLGADGTVLAANDAALAFIGVTSGADALGRDFSAWISSDDRERWKAFTSRVLEGCPASIECDLAAAPGTSQPTLFHGVPLTDHPDGEVSVAIAARNVSGKRQLESAVVELEEQIREREAELDRTRTRLAESEASRRAAEEKCHEALGDVRQLEVALGEFTARQKRLTAERAAEEQRFQELSEAAASVRELELNAARGLRERDRLAASLQEREAAIRALESERSETHAELEQAQRDRERLEGALHETQQTLAEADARASDAGAARDALQSRLDDALTACQERERALRPLETALDRLAAEHGALKANHERLVGALRDQAARLEALANGGFAAAGAADMPDAPGGPDACHEDGTR